MTALLLVFLLAADRARDAGTQAQEVTDSDAPGPPIECVRSKLNPRLQALLGPRGDRAPCLDPAARPVLAPCGARGCVLSAGAPPRRLTLALGSTESEVGLNRRRSSANQLCAETFVPAQPTLRFVLTGPPVPSLELRLARWPMLAMYVRSPDGRWFCDQLRDQTDQSIVVGVDQPLAGTWSVWVGASTEVWMDQIPFATWPTRYPAKVELVLSTSAPVP